MREGAMFMQVLQDIRKRDGKGGKEEDKEEETKMTKEEEEE
jgi:hypothetical protein